jgi:hypothetical protein
VIAAICTPVTQVAGRVEGGDQARGEQRLADGPPPVVRTVRHAGDVSVEFGEPVPVEPDGRPVHRLGVVNGQFVEPAGDLVVVSRFGLAQQVPQAATLAAVLVVVVGGTALQPGR